MPRKKNTEIDAEVKINNQDNLAEPEETIKEDVLENAVTEVSKDDLSEKPQDELAETPKKLRLSSLKLDSDDDVRSEMSQQDVIWNEIANANRSKRILTATITGLENSSFAGPMVIADYKGQRIAIPVSEMMIDLSDDKKYNYGDIDERLSRICNMMLGAEIDIVIKGIDKKMSSVVASRKDAMLKKRKRFYMTPLSDGLAQVREGRVVEGRIIAVTPMVARIELFGVEVSMSASELSWDWVSDVSEKFFVGDRINVLIEKIEGDSLDDIKITPNVKSLIPNTSVENLTKCIVQGKYIGEITNIHNGIAYIRLQIGVNAIAHTNYDKRTPGKGDIVSYVITRINQDYGNVSGVITRIIKQNI